MGHLDSRAASEGANLSFLLSFVRGSFEPDQFRRFVRARSPGGATLAEQLPGAQAPAATLYHEGVDVLWRNGYIAADLFDALAREFPRKHAEIAEVARRCNVEWKPPPPTPLVDEPPRKTYTAVAVAVAVAAAAVSMLIVLYPWSPAPVVDDGPAAKRPLPVQEPAATSSSQNTPSTPLAPPPDQKAPDTEVADGGVTDVKKSPGKKTSRDNTKNIQGADPRTAGSDEDESKPPPPPPPPKKPVCAIPGSLRAELQRLALRILKKPGLSKDFTVTLSSGADHPRVSPEPRPGEAAIAELHTYLTKLGPADLGHCTDRSLTVHFEVDRTTVEFND